MMHRNYYSRLAVACVRRNTGWAAAAGPGSWSQL